jgi:hypothetical protein
MTDGKWYNPYTKGESSMDDTISIDITRAELITYLNALECSMDHAEQTRGPRGKTAHLATLVELHDRACIALLKLDKTPMKEWDERLRKRA